MRGKEGGTGGTLPAEDREPHAAELFFDVRRLPAVLLAPLRLADPPPLPTLAAAAIQDHLDALNAGEPALPARRMSP